MIELLHREIIAGHSRGTMPRRILRVAIADGDKRARVEQIIRSVNVNTPMKSAEHLGRQTEQTAVEADLAVPA